MIRLLKRTSYWVATLLILGVTGLDAPELLTLSEDVSNESAMAWCLEEVAARLRSGRATPQRRAGCIKIETFGAEKPQNLASSVLLPSKAGRDLLRLLSLQRI